MKYHLPLVIVVSLAFFVFVPGVSADDEENVAYRKSGANWREVAEGHPADFQYLRDQIGWREAVLSYMRDGPGIFNVAPDRQAALIDRAQMYVIERDGFEITSTGLEFVGSLLDTGSPKLIKSYAHLVRQRREAELMYASERMIDDLQKKDYNAEHRQFLLDALKEIDRRLNRAMTERRKVEPVDAFAVRHRKAQDRLVEAKLKSIREFLAKHEKVDDKKPKEESN